MSVRKIPPGAFHEDLALIGLYGGLKMGQINVMKGIKPNQNVLSCLGFTEMAAYYFCATQTIEEIQRENITEKRNIRQAYLMVGEKTRHTIKELGNPMPENLPLVNGNNK
jgi:hypothetical protein